MAEVNGGGERQESAVSSALKGTLIAAGVGLTFAHQPWGRRMSKFLGRVADTTRNTFSNEGIARQINKRIGQYTKTDTSRFLSVVKQNWRNSEVNVERIQLNRHNRGSGTWSVGNWIQDIENAKSRASRAEIIGREWALDRIYGSNYVQGVINSFDQNTQRNLRKYAKDILQTATNEEANRLLAKKFQLEGAAATAAEDIAQFTRDTWIKTMSSNRSANKYTSDMGGDDNEYFGKLLSGLESAIEKRGYDIETLERNLGTAQRKSAQDRFLEKLTGAHKMTWKEMKDLLSDHNKRTQIDGQYTVDGQLKSIAAKMEDIEKSMLAKKDDSYDRLMQVTVDESNLFMTDEGNAFSKEATGDIWRSFLGVARNTLPGKLFKIGDIDNALKLHGVQYLGRQTRDPVFQSFVKRIGEEDKVHLRLGHELYSIDPNSGVSAKVDHEFNVVSGRFGFHHTQVEALAGLSKTRVSDNSWFRRLDVFQDREEYSGQIIQNTMDKYSSRNAREEKFYGLLVPPNTEFRQAIHEIEEYANNGGNVPRQSLEYLNNYLDNAKSVNKLFRSHTYKLQGDVIENLLQNSNLAQDSRELLEAVQSGDIFKMISAADSKRLGQQGGTDFLNRDLQNILTEYRSNPERALDKIELVTTSERLSFGSDLSSLLYDPMGNETYLFGDILQRELGREAILRQGLKTGGEIDYQALNNLVDNLNVSTRSKKEVNKLIQRSFLQERTNINRKLRNGQEFYYDLMSQAQDFNKLMTEDLTSEARIFRDTYEEILEDEISTFEGAIEPDIAGSGNLNTNIFLNRSASPLDIVKGINEWIMSKGTGKLEADLSNIWKGLTASRDDLSHVNLYTEVPFFAFKRLSDELNRVGLGFSSESMKSTGDLAMAFMTKRVLPIAVGSTYLDWLDDTSRETTGVGLWQATTAGVADIDLGMRKVLSGLGADDWLKQTKAVNPIWQYWGDKDEYQSYEERQKYYQEGYTPVRKAAWLKMVCQVKIAELSRKAKFLVKKNTLIRTEDCVKHSQGQRIGSGIMSPRGRDYSNENRKDMLTL